MWLEQAGGLGHGMKKYKHVNATVVQQNNELNLQKQICLKIISMTKNVAETHNATESFGSEKPSECECLSLWV